MLKFLFLGLIRDKSRSLLPIIVVSIGVLLTVFLESYMSGIFSDSIESTAKLQTGHVKVMTKAYSENMSQIPNESALENSPEILQQLKAAYPDMDWAERIMFGGLVDAPDSSGLTKAQGNVMGTAVDLLNSQDEIDRLEIKSKLQSGHLPEKSGEILITQKLFQKMNLHLGDTLTLISSSMFGEMVMYNFEIAGTIHFGIEAIDKGMIYADIEDIRMALNMQNCSGEILGFNRGEPYDSKKAKKMSQEFNAKSEGGEFTPVMLSMNEMNAMDFMIAYSENAKFIVIFIFVFAMSIVLWNAGLVGALRRYGEFGLRLAIGENKHEIYKTLIGEAILIGLIGSIIGTSIGLFFSYLLYKFGLDISGMMNNSTLMLPSVVRSQITTTTWFIGFIPGLLSTVIGASLAGIGIYKRQTAHLFKELDA